MSRPNQDLRSALRVIKAVNILTLVFLAFILAACTLTQQQKDNLGATGSHIARRAAQIALQTVINSAINPDDREEKTDYLEGLALGLRSQQGAMVTSDDIKTVVDIWTPKGTEWNQLGTKLADAYKDKAPATPKEAAKVLEGMAQGVEAAAAEAK